MVGDREEVGCEDGMRGLAGGPAMTANRRGRAGRVRSRLLSCTERAWQLEPRQTSQT